MSYIFTLAVLCFYVVLFLLCIVFCTSAAVASGPVSQWMPNFKIGCALFENGSECFGQILLNLLSRGLRTESVKFIQFYEKENLCEMIQSDSVTDQSEWQLIVDLIPDPTYKAKILVQLTIRDAIFESHEAAKSDFDFYS